MKHRINPTLIDDTKVFKIKDTSFLKKLGLPTKDTEILALEICDGDDSDEISIKIRTSFGDERDA